MKGVTSPEGLIMLIVAGLFDVTGFIIFALGTWFGVDDYGILEMIGIVVFGAWMYSRYGPLGEDPFLKVKQERARIQEEMEGQGESEQQEGEEEAGKEKQAESGKDDSKTDSTKKSEGGGATAGQEQKQDGVKPGKTAVPTKPDTPGAKKPLLSTKPTGRGWQSPRDIIKDEAWKLVRKALKRFGLTFLIELIPFLGGFYPGWTIFVWKEMKDVPPTMPKQETQKTSKATQAEEREPQYSSKA